MNCITRFANSLVNRIVCADNASLSSQKEISMNTNHFRHSVARITRGAVGLFALVGLLGFSHKAANADVTIDYMVGPQQNLGVAVGTTALQIKVRNSDAFTVTGISIQTYVYLDSDVNNGWLVRAMPKSATFSMQPNSTQWITIPLPTYSLQGNLLVGRQLYAKALMGNHEAWLRNFLDIPAAANVQSGAVRLTRFNSDGSKTFTITFTNNGYIPSTTTTAYVSTWRYADGPDGPALNLTGSIPALAVGASAVLTFTTQPTQGEEIRGTVKVGTGNLVGFSL